MIAAIAIDARLQRLLALYDALAGCDHSFTSLFDATTPGAADALRAWAGELGLSVTERLHSDDAQPFVCVAITTKNYAHISVHVPIQGETK